MKEKFVYAKLTGPTASFRIPSFLDGVLMALNTPGYSNLLGMLSFAANREVSYKETNIAYRYSYQASGLDLERFHRYKRNRTGKYKYEKTNIRRREMHFDVTLELLLSNPDFFEILDNPYRQLFFGRSQDLASVEEVTMVEGHHISKGKLSGTMIPININDDLPGDGIFYNLPEYFDYMDGKVRKPKNVRTFLALPEYDQEITNNNLYHIPSKDQCYYLHQWLGD